MVSRTVVFCVTDRVRVSAESPSAASAQIYSPAISFAKLRFLTPSNRSKQLDLHKSFRSIDGYHIYWLPSKSPVSYRLYLHPSA